MNGQFNLCVALTNLSINQQFWKNTNKITARSMFHSSITNSATIKPMSSTASRRVHATRHAFPLSTPTTRNSKSVILVKCNSARRWDKFSFCTSFSTSESKFVVRSASSAPLSGDYSEQFVGDKSKQDRQRIAGIDQDEIEDPTRLADSDSCFCKFNGVEIHHKICEPDVSSPPDSSLQEASISQLPERTERTNYPVILLHGFGASVFSWNRVMKSLSKVTGSKVLAFDRPAFGLTSRSNANEVSSHGEEDSRPLNPFSMVFSVLATLYFIDFLAAGKAILVGHSAGALVAVDTYFEAPERVAALILVAPAIVAPFITRKTVREEKRGETDDQKQGKGSFSGDGTNPFAKFLSILSNITKFIAEAMLRVLRGMTDMINALYKEALSAILRSTIGLMVIRTIIDKFGISAVRSAWYDSSQVSDHVIEGYTKPLKVKGWDKALAEFTVAMLTDDSASKTKQPLTERLGEISCPVLIITGDTDRLVPSWNSVRLSKAIPGSCLEIIRQCGHLPHEEKAEEFVSVVEKFLKRVFNAAAAEEVSEMIQCLGS